jgi:TonB family protein
MRSILAASVLLSPLFLTAAAVASTPANDASASTPVQSVSTGVIPAQILQSSNIEVPSFASLPADTAFVVQLNVDADGDARDIQVVKSFNPELDAPVVAAVRKFRFRPATLDNQVIPITMDLTVQVQH